MKCLDCLDLNNSYSAALCSLIKEPKVSFWLQDVTTAEIPLPVSF